LESLEYINQSRFDKKPFRIIFIYYATPAKMNAMNIVTL
jgi:hypothetical protein